MEGISSRRFEKICVFGGLYPGKNKRFADVAIRLGEVLAQEKIQLIYGGGNLGLMGAVAEIAYTGGTQVLGVIPGFLLSSSGRTLGKVLQVGSVHERLSYMYHSADAFIALPGGLSTLEEVACVASWSSLMSYKKPIGLLNVNGYYDSLISFLDNAVENGFIFSDARSSIMAAATVEALLTKLQHFKCCPTTVVVQGSGSRKRKREVDNKGVDCTLSL